MPDPAKHAALRSMGFKIARTCSTCANWHPTTAIQYAAWGYCRAAGPYQHTKHSESRPLGTPAIGSCDQHAADPVRASVRVGDDYAARYMEDDE